MWSNRGNCLHFSERYRRCEGDFTAFRLFTPFFDAAYSVMKGVIRMNFYLIVCRSLTYAQRTVAALEHSGIPATIVRSPTGVSASGCSYAVKITHKRLTDAATALNRAGLPPVSVYSASGDGSYREVSL